VSHRILIVEDDKHFAAQLKELFDYHGLHARVAVTGPEGIEAFGNGGADFVLVDVMLPQVHGLKVLEQIRSMPAGADVPAILMSAVYKNETMFAPDLARLAVHQFLPKPFSLIDLGRKVNGILAEPEGGRASVRMLHAKREAEKPTPVETPPAPREPPPAFEDRATVPMGAVTDSDVQAGTAGTTTSEGDLDRAGYARLITHLFHSHLSGVLQLEHDGDQLTLYLLNGYPVWAETPRPSDLLEWLIGEGVLQRTQVAHLFALRTAPEMRSELLRAGLLDPDDLAPLMEAWLAWQVRRTLNATSGSYQFEATDDFAGMIPVYEVNPIRELWLALREVPAGRLEGDLTVLAGREIGRTRSFNRLFGYIGNTAELRELGEHLLRTRPLDEVRARFRDDDSTRCLWLLISAGLVSVADSPSSKAPRQAPKRRSRVPAGLRRPPATSRPAAASRPPTPSPPAEAPRPQPETRRYGRDTVAALRAAAPPTGGGEGDTAEARVARDYVTRMELDHYGFLGVSGDASSDAIDEAYQDLAPRYRLRNLGSELHADTRRQAKELLTKLVEAFGELSDPARRARYDDALSRASAAGRKPPGARTNPGTAPPSASEGPLTGYPTAESDARVAESAGSLGPELVKRWLQARRAMATGEHRRSMIALESLRTELPSEPGVLADLAWCRFNTGIPTDARTQDKSLEWVALAVAFQPGHPDVVEVNARILAFSDSHADALRALKRLAKARPELGWVPTQIKRHTRLLEAAEEGGTMFSGLFGRRK